MINKKVHLLLVVLFFLFSIFTIGGTLAYFTDADTVVNTFYVDKNVIEVEEEFEQPIRGKKTIKTPTALNTGNTDCYVRALVVVSDSRAENYFTFYYNDAEGFNTSDWKEEDDGWMYYRKSIKRDEMTAPVFSHIFLSQNLPDSLQGFTIDVLFESVQSKGFPNAKKAFAALKEGGVV